MKASAESIQGEKQKSHGLVCLLAFVRLPEPGRQEFEKNLIMLREEIWLLIANIATDVMKSKASGQLSPFKLIQVCSVLGV